MIDLTPYTGAYRKGRFIRFGNIQNKKEFPTLEEAEKYEKLYNTLAVKALQEMMFIIKENNIVRGAKRLSKKDLAHYASLYYLGGGIGGGNIEGPTLDEILNKTKELYSLSKNTKLLKKIGLI